MENQVVKRRTSVITAHLVSHEDLSATATHVFPMSCSNSLNSVIRRYDNRTYFARQGSASQGSYMRQSSTKQGNFVVQGNFVQPSVPSKSMICGNKQCSGAPAFSRPARVETGTPTVRRSHSVVQGCTYTDPAPEAPLFARPYQKRAQPQSEDKKQNVAPKGFEWSPRMDVVESGLTYIVTLELPGVSTNSIKVEVDDQNLIIKGNRSNWSCGAANSNNSAMSYHRREILQGPYRIVWPLPNNANKENVSAEIQDGVLRVTIPKLSGLRWLRKAYM